MLKERICEGLPQRGRGKSGRRLRLKTARTVFQILRSKQRPVPSRDGVSSPIGIGQQLGFVRITPDACAARPVCSA